MALGAEGACEYGRSADVVKGAVVNGSPVDIPLRVAVIGAGPAGLAAANDLNQMGYTVTVFEKNENAGGLLRYGIPNFKLNKAVIDRRLRLMEQEGITFRFGEECRVMSEESTIPVPSGAVKNVAEANSSLFTLHSSLSNFDAVIIATGTPTARDLKAPGRELKGVHFALELLSQQNRVLAGMEFTKDERITAKTCLSLVVETPEATA